MIGLRALLESRLFYYPDRAHFLKAPTAEEVYFTSADGLRLHGWFFRADSPPGSPPPPAVVHAHGNAGNINWHTEFSSFFPREGFSLLMFDYRGYGKSDPPKGRLSRADLIDDTKAAIDYVASRPDIDARRVAVYGVSLGGVIGLAAAADRPNVGAVVTVSAFSTWQGVVADHAGGLVSRLIASGSDAARIIARIAPRPLLIVHGQNDRIVPVAHAHQLKAAADRAGLAAEVIIDPAADHNDIVYVNKALQKQIAAWLHAALGSAGLTPAPAAP
jgi:dipeptidyl aminopeptidase/acylaminoacyl peptidase